jgi:hypothetical protein
MTHSLDFVKSFPLTDDHLHGAAVLASSLIDHQAATSDCRAQLESLQVAVDAIWRAIHNLEDILDRMDITLQMAVAAKEHPSFKVPDWFFHPENENPRGMLLRRSRYLKAARVPIDDAWDLLTEFSESAHLAITQEVFRKVIREVYAQGDK